VETGSINSRIKSGLTSKFSNFNANNSGEFVRTLLGSRKMGSGDNHAEMKLKSEGL
jgi:hypothetical protein